MKPFFLIVFLLISASVLSQVVVYEDYVPEKGSIYSKESIWNVFIYTAGFGATYKRGHYSQRFRYSAWEIDFSTIWNPKDFKIQAFGKNFGNARRYVPGQINSLIALRGGYGGRWRISEKPFWGGVNLDLNYSGGLSIALAIPQYLYILHEDENPETGEKTWRRELEKFDPENIRHHSYDLIYGRGPLFYGVWHLRPYPGIYARGGFEFEFGKNEEKLRSLEAGLLMDYYFIPIPLMAENPKKSFFFNFFIAFNFGKRFNIR